MNSTPNILIVDSAPDRSSAINDVLQGFFTDYPTIRVVCESLIGVSNARNRALKECTTPLLAFLDDDCVASPGWIDNLLAAYSSTEHAGAIGGKVLGVWEAQPPSWLSAQLISYLSLLDLGALRKDIRPPEYLVGGNILYSVDAVLSVGGFKTFLGRVGDTLLSNEEIEVCNALYTAGYKLVYEPSALVEHFIPLHRLQQAWFRKRIFWQAISDLLMIHSDQIDWDPDLKEKKAAASILGDTLPNDLDSEQFERQLKSIYNSLRILAEGAVPLQSGTIGSKTSQPT